VTLNDYEWPFNVKFCFWFKFEFKMYLFTYKDSAMVKVTCIRAGSMFKAIKYSKS